ncbi:MAG: PKD domain-containing protein, partial [Candidatus Helarchaeota archaeon]
MKKKGIALTITTLAIIGIILSQAMIYTLSQDVIPEIQSFTVNKSVADVYEEIQFDVTLVLPSGPVSHYVYNFRDGAEPLVTSNKSVIHSFPFEGSYLVTVIAVGMGGIMDQATVKVTIENERPSAGIFMETTSAFEDENVTLSASNVHDPKDLDVLRFQWLFGDGNYLEGESVTWSWSTAGRYPVTLTVYDDQNALSTITDFINITNVNPEADFTLSRSDIHEDELITFNASSSTDSPSDQPILQYYWDFGDGAVGRGKVTEHAYAESGEYGATLIVVDDNGVKNEHSKVITVMNDPPSIEIIDP